MVRISECYACQMGDHKRCHGVIQAVPKGMIGGVVCGCEGECVERGPHGPIVRQAEMISRMFRKAPR